MKRVILKSCSVVLLLLGLANIADYIYASAATNATTSNLSMQATILPSMTVVIDDTNPTLNITPSSTGTFDSTSINVSAYSNGSIGYNLTMTPSDTDLTGVRTGDTIPTLTSGSYTSANFPTGYWGVAVDNGNYVPAAVTNLASASSSNANASNATHAVNLAANLDLTTAMDSYSTTLTFAATATVQTYPITFNFNNNITSLAIKDANNVTKATITTSGDSTNLDFASTYTIVPTYANNAGLSVIWLDSGEGYVNSSNFTYTVGSGSGTVGLAALVYMQEFNNLSSAWGTAIKNSMIQNKDYQLRDNRDEKSYFIAKLADDNIWMTQNLDHDIVTTANFYTPSNTNIVSNWTASTATYATGVTTWATGATGNTTPNSYNPGDLCWNGILKDDLSGTIATETVACNDNNKHYHIGNYYNWTAAVAMNNSSSHDSESSVIAQSICPAGWTLPRSRLDFVGSGSFSYLVEQLSLSAGVNGNIQHFPTYFTYAGRWDGSSHFVSYTSGYWSLDVYDENTAYELNFNRNGYLDAQRAEDVARSYGHSIRCMVVNAL